MKSNEENVSKEIFKIFGSKSKFEKLFLSHPRISMGAGMICTALVSAVLGFVSSEINQKNKEKIIPAKKRSIEKKTNLKREKNIGIRENFYQGIVKLRG